MRVGKARYESRPRPVTTGAALPGIGSILADAPPGSAAAGLLGGEASASTGAGGAAAPRSGLAQIARTLRAYSPPMSGVSE